jgi:hypothetical protein
MSSGSEPRPPGIEAFDFPWAEGLTALTAFVNLAKAVLPEVAETA